MSMKSHLVTFVAVFSFLGVSMGVETEYFSISPDDAVRVQRQFKLYEEGLLNLNDLCVSNSAEGGRKIAGYYLTYTNVLPVKAELPVGMWLAEFGMRAEAARLAEDYVGAYPNDSYGWRSLGKSLMHMDNAASFRAFRRAADLGDRNAYELLLLEAGLSGRFEAIQDLIPDILKVQHEKDISQDYRQELTMGLLLYSEATKREEVFTQALRGVDLSLVVVRKDIVKVAMGGFRQFKGEEAEKLSQEFQRELEKVNGNAPQKDQGDKPEKGP